MVPKCGFVTLCDGQYCAVQHKFTVVDSVSTDHIALKKPIKFMISGS